MIARLLDRLSELVLQRPWRIIIVALLVVAGAAAFASRMTVDADFLQLLPENHRDVNDFRELITAIGTLDMHVIVFQFPRGAEPSAYLPLIDAVGEELASSPLISTVTWKIPDPFEMIDRVMPYSMLLLAPEQVQSVAVKLTDENIHRSVERNASLLQTPQSMVSKELIQADPFNLLPIYLETINRTSGGLRADFSSGYYISADQSTAVIFAKPRRAAQELAFSRAVMEETTRITEKAAAQFRRDNPAVPLPAIGFTGGYAIAAADEAILRSDMTLNSIASFGGVLLLYLFAYRRARPLLYAAVPMSAAIVITFAIGALTFGTLSAVSTGFAALLAGLGVDFMTVLYERYVDERNRGAGVALAVRTMMTRSLPGVVVGALTTAVTFYAFLATDFRGMFQLGFLTGTGIIVFMFCTIFVLPALLVIAERRDEARPVPQVRSFGSQLLVRTSLAHSQRVIVFWCILVALAAAAATQVRFSDDILNLRAEGNEGLRLQDVVAEKFGQSFEFMMYGVRGKTAAEAAEKTAAAVPDLEMLAKRGTIGSYQAITTFLPSREQQRRVIALLEAGEDDEFSFERIERTFRQALMENGFRADAYDHFLERFEEALEKREPLTLDAVEQLGLASGVDRFMKKTADGYLSIVYLYPRTATWPRNLPEGLRQFRARHPEGALTGINLVAETLRGIIVTDAIRASLAGFVVVFLLLWIGFRSFARSCLVFVPFAAGCTSMLGFMGVFGIQFNFMNIFVGLMLVGTATDYAVYMLERYDEAPDDFAESGGEIARAVTLAALMSIIGFGSFAISHYPGVRSLGFASTFGIALSCLASTTLLPALLATGRFRRSSRAAEHVWRR